MYYPKTIKSYHLFIIGVLYAVLIFGFYYKTKGAGFVFDTIDWFNDYIDYPHFNLLKPNFDIVFRPFYHLIQFYFFNFFGLNEKAWFALYAGSFWLLCMTVFYYFDTLLHRLNIKDAREIAFFSSLLLVLSPFATEAVVWYCCIHYFVVLISLFLSLIWFLNTHKKWTVFNLTLLHSLFLISIGSQELSIIIPFIVFAHFILLKQTSQIAQSYKSYIQLILAPQILIFVVYCGLNFYYNHLFFGHYSSEKLNFSPAFMMAHLIVFFVKFLGLVNLIQENKFSILYDFIMNNQILCDLMFMMMVASSMYLLYKKTKLFSDASNRNVLLFLGGSLIFAFAPVATLFVHQFKEIELDRLSLAFSIFFYAIFVLLIYYFCSPKTRYLLLGIYITLSSVLLYDYTFRWKQAYIVKKNMIMQFPTDLKGEIYILAAPCNYKYTYINAIKQTKELYASLKVFRKIYFKEKIYVASYYNMNVIDEGITVKQLDSNRLECELFNWGSWFWSDIATGLTKIDSPTFSSVRKDQNGSKFVFEIKHRNANQHYLIFNKLNWKEYKWQDHPNDFFY